MLIIKKLIRRKQEIRDKEETSKGKIHKPGILQIKFSVMQMKVRQT